MVHQATRHILPAKKTIPGKSSELSVIIPAAGMGKRMRSKDAKALMFINNKTTLIERQLELIWDIYPKADILLVAGYNVSNIRHHLKNYPVRIIYNPNYATTNVAFSISLGLQAAISHHCLLVYGDLIFNKDSIKSITENKSNLILDENNIFNSDEVGVVIDENKNVSNMAFGLSKKWAQIAYIEGKELELFKEICYNESTINWFGYELFNDVINRGGTFKSQSIKTSLVFDIDSPQDLQKTKEWNIYD